MSTPNPQPQINLKSGTPEKRAFAKHLRQNMTPAETILWQALRRNQLGGYHFRRQQVLLGFIADFYCHRSRLVVEVDGPIHQQQREYDQERDRILADAGLTTLRITNQQVEQNLLQTLQQILTACRRSTGD
jgi:very-short-patch-repair endonuclease